MMKIVTAADVAGDPDLYNLAWRIGRGTIEWDCTGYSRDGKNVRFARLVVGEHGLRQITRYVAPEQIVHQSVRPDE